MPDPARVFKDALSGYLRENGITIQSESYAYSDNTLLGRPVMKAMRVVDSILSPTLDSINHWFLKKSVNLYGEALLKSIGKRYYRYGLNAEIYDSAINKLKDFWMLKGIDAASLNIIDGSGLSPANRLTAHALVSVLLYARGRAWFPSFYDALPELNGTRMKDGYISGVRSYAGYVKSASGTEYSFSFLVNNFSGNPATVREKMWRLLDILK
jgi:D-alanyl-D-alanine carboxypeptidase/D-alanyl-D-alanine-endopeptidase (penicillin-binding protein 4)